jgi:hypothetical protein
MIKKTSVQGGTSAVGVRDRRDYRLVLMAAFVLCLAGAIIERLMSFGRRSANGEKRLEGETSILGQAKAQASIAASAALMG